MREGSFRNSMVAKQLFSRGVDIEPNAIPSASWMCQEVFEVSFKDISNHVTFPTGLDYARRQPKV